MHRIIVVGGHYGSGKSEVSINLALQWKKKYEVVALGDLDIVNVYFRSREKADFLEEKGIRVFSSALGHNSTLDVPAVSAKIRPYMYQEDARVILDVGGDPAGARVLGLFRDDLRKLGCDFLCVINGNRPETSDCAKALASMKKIEAAAGMPFTGLISNTHLLTETTVEHTEKGIKLCEEISMEKAIPLRYVCLKEDLPALKECKGSYETLSIGEYLREKWMK